MKQPQGQQWVNPQKAAQITGLSTRTMQKYAAAGRVPNFKVGKRILFEVSELRAWMSKYRRD